MGMLDQAALQQAKKSQGETNDRLECLIREQQQTNVLLGQIVQLLAAQQQVVQQPQGQPSRTTWGVQG